MIGSQCGDEVGIDVDTDHMVPECCESATDPARAAAGVQDSRCTLDHRIDQTGLAVKIAPLGGHHSESFDVPRRMIGILFDHPQPARCRSHRDRRLGSVGEAGAGEAIPAVFGSVDECAQTERGVIMLNEFRAQHRCQRACPAALREARWLGC